MEYRVEDLAQAGGVRVDTVRFYQTRGLLDAPRKRGRVAIYDDQHLARLRRIRDLQRQGFKLEQIQRVLEEADSQGGDALLGALLEKKVGTRTLSEEELAAEAGLPPAMIRAAVDAGLLCPMQVEGRECYGEADAEMARTGLSLLTSGFPLQDLLEVATAHAEHVRQVCERGIDLFDDHVRKQGPSAGDDQAIARNFETLLPLVTRLVAVHFQRTLVTRALERLEGNEESTALQAALRTTEASHLEVDVTWR